MSQSTKSTKSTNYGYPLPSPLQKEKKFQDYAVGNGHQNTIHKGPVVSESGNCKINNRYPCAFKNFH